MFHKVQKCQLLKNQSKEHLEPLCDLFQTPKRLLAKLLPNQDLPRLIPYFLCKEVVDWQLPSCDKLHREYHHLEILLEPHGESGLFQTRSIPAPPNNGNEHYEHRQLHWLEPYLLKGHWLQKGRLRWLQDLPQQLAYESNIW